MKEAGDLETKSKCRKAGRLRDYIQFYGFPVHSTAGSLRI